MKIQIISNTKNIKAEGYDVVYSTLNNPATFDSYDVNIIDLQNESIWRNKGSSSTTINCIGDFNSLQVLIESATKANIIVALPQNYTFYYDESRYNNGYNSHFALKDKLDTLKYILSCILPKSLKTNYGFAYDLAFENAKTSCGNSSFPSAFYFSKLQNLRRLTKANDSGKATTISATQNCILTTLNLSDSGCKIKDFFVAIGLEKENKKDMPEWLNEVHILDDKAQQEAIEKNTSRIAELQEEIKKSKDKLNENLYYKSVLSETGDNLVEVVFDMLGKMLNYDLSKFVDKKKEDFNIKLNNVTFIGEIKGINTNVKSVNISQVEHHCRKHEDAVQDSEENIKGLLVINTFRDKKLEERAEVHIDSVKLAEKYGVLIITTMQLLDLFENFISEKVTSDNIIEAFKTQIGLLDIDKI